MECRAKVYLVCFEVKKVGDLRNSRGQNEWLQHLRTVVGPNFDIEDQTHPTGLCTNFRKKFFSTRAIEEEVEFTIPQYLYKVVVYSEHGNQTCDCIICQKLRPKVNGIPVNYRIFVRVGVNKNNEIAKIKIEENPV